jgi:hypothetical protein
VPPSVAAPALDGAPASIRGRTPLPFCGAEDTTTHDVDPAIRRCFVDGLLAGSPVELISRSPSTEGDPVVSLLRWSGTGSIERSVHADGSWARNRCAITLIETDAAFENAGGCDPIAS